MELEHRLVLQLLELFLCWLGETMGPLSLEDILRHEVALLKAKVEKLEEELGDGTKEYTSSRKFDSLVERSVIDRIKLLI